MELRQAAFKAFKSTDLESKMTLAGELIDSSAILTIVNDSIIAPHAALVHAICHIEFNAIKMAWHASAFRIAGPSK